MMKGLSVIRQSRLKDDKGPFTYDVSRQRGGGSQPIPDFFLTRGFGDFSVVRYSSCSQENFTAHKPEPHETLKN